MRDSNNQLKASYINSGINKYITPKHVFLSRSKSVISEMLLNVSVVCQGL